MSHIILTQEDVNDIIEGFSTKRFEKRSETLIHYNGNPVYQVVYFDKESGKLYQFVREENSWTDPNNAQELTEVEEVPTVKYVPKSGGDKITFESDNELLSSNEDDSWDSWDDN